MAHILTKANDALTLSNEALQHLRASLRGTVITPNDAGYDAARSIWNAMIDRYPALIVQCAGAADVMHALAFAKANQLVVAVRGGGHNIAGSALCDGGLVIDLSGLRSVRVDPVRMRADVAPGALLSDVDRETQAFGLVTPLGINSTTGVAGLTLGGGFGWLSRKYGMTVDNLVSADVVTADGRLLRASERENADLFWAIRGGGGNFGIITNFEFRLHRLDRNVQAGLIVFPFDQASTVLRKYRDLVVDLPEEANLWVVMRKAPLLPFLPAEIHGKEVIVLALFNAGDAALGERLLEAIKAFGHPAGAMFGSQPYTAWQQAFDPLLAPGARNYWKSQNLSGLTDEVIGKVLHAVNELPSDHSEVFLALLDGQVSRTAPDATAFAHRDVRFVINLHGRWTSPAEDAAGVAWARANFDALAPDSSGGVYVNFMTQEEHERVKAAYGPGWSRVMEVKKKWDPTNVFRTNQNIQPAA